MQAQICTRTDFIRRLSKLEIGNVTANSALIVNEMNMASGLADTQLVEGRV